MKKILISLLALLCAENYSRSPQEIRRMKQNPIVQIAAAELRKNGSLNRFYHHHKKEVKPKKKSECIKIC